MNEDQRDLLLAALLREPTEAERHQNELSFMSYRSFAAGVEWGAQHGRGEWDDAAIAWSEWADTDEDDSW